MNGKHSSGVRLLLRVPGVEVGKDQVRATARFSYDDLVSSIQGKFYEEFCHESAWDVGGLAPTAVKASLENGF
ncbi:MAG: hypothetical protein WBV46_04250 [Terriglobales bacterium]|jgi:hypothetical protein